MAQNVKYPGNTINLRLPVASGITSGDVDQLGDALVVLALEDRDSAGYAVCKTPFAYVADVSVHAANNAGDTAVAIGDAIYYDPAIPELNKDDTNGDACGYALEAITSGATDTILVGFTQ